MDEVIFPIDPFCPLTEHHEERDDDERSDVFVEKGGSVEAPEELDEDALGVAGHGFGVGQATDDVVPGNIVQSCVKTFLISSETHPQNLPLPTLKMHFDATFQPAIPGTWQEYFYTTLYRGSLSEMGAKLREYLLFSCRLTSSAKRPTKQVICIKKLMTTARPALRANVLTAGTVTHCHIDLQRW